MFICAVVCFRPPFGSNWFLPANSMQVAIIEQMHLFQFRYAKPTQHIRHSELSNTYSCCHLLCHFLKQANKNSIKDRAEVHGGFHWLCYDGLGAFWPLLGSSISEWALKMRNGRTFTICPYCIALHTVYHVYMWNGANNKSVSHSCVLLSGCCCRQTQQ